LGHDQLRNLRVGGEKEPLLGEEIGIEVLLDEPNRIKSTLEPLPRKALALAE
jgi:hypothetical protein